MIVKSEIGRKPGYAGKESVVTAESGARQKGNMHP